MIKEVIKRDGRRVPFDVGKIEQAIMNAAEASGGTNKKLAKQLAFDVCDMLDEKYGGKGRSKVPKVDDIQNCIEKVLIESGHAKTAKAFILYRAERDRIREAQSDLMKTIGELTEKDSKDMDNKRENANINADTAMGAMLKFGSESAKAYNLANLVTREYSDAHKNGDIHIHDLDFFSLTETCVAGDTMLTARVNWNKVEYTADGLWRYIARSKYNEITENTGLSEWINTETETGIISSNGKFTKIIRAKRSKIAEDEKLLHIETTVTKLKVTGSHRIPIYRNGIEQLVSATDIRVGDMLYFVEMEARPIYTEVKQIEEISKEDVPFVYDFETEDHYFVANGILVHNCCQIDLTKLFTNGFSTGHGYLREPNDIKSYAALACIAIQSNQNDQHGGQSVPKFDYDMAKGVAKTFCKEFKRNLKTYLSWQGNMSNEILAEKIEVIDKQIHEYIEQSHGHIMNDAGYAFIREKVTDTFSGFAEFTKDVLDKLIKDTVEQADKETHQAMEALVHNLNTMQCRAGAQVPFSSINLGTDTSTEGRMVTKNLLLAMEEGLGNGETPIFPIVIFKVKDGVNYEEGTPNHDLLELSLRVTAKRMFPKQNIGACA